MGCNDNDSISYFRLQLADSDPYLNAILVGPGSGLGILPGMESSGRGMIEGGMRECQQECFLDQADRYVCPLNSGCCPVAILFQVFFQSCFRLE